MIMSFSAVRGLVVLQFCFISRIIPILRDEQVSSGFISVFSDLRSFCKGCWSGQWDSFPK